MIMSSKMILGFSAVICCWGMLSGCAQTPKDNGQASASAEFKPISAQPEPPLLTTPQLPPLRLKEGYPQQYTVQLEDTTWSIADLYLDNPWRWRELWPRSMGIEEVISLYPGDVIEVIYSGDQPMLRLVEGTHSTIKLSPQIRVEYINQKIPPITREAVKSFVNNSVVLSEADWKGAPYVVASVDGRNTMPAGTSFFARGRDFDRTEYRVFRPEGELRDPDSNAFLGFNLTYIGDALLDEGGDPARMQLVSTRQPVRAGDRLLPTSETASGIFSFDPIPAPPDSNGQILQLPDDNISAPSFSTVIVNLGDLDDMRPGSVLEILNPGRQTEDPLTGAVIELPGEKAGFIVLYRIFDRVSYGLVTHAMRPIRVADPVRDPAPLRDPS